MNKLFDLRLVIGLFFLVVGTLLLGYALLSSEIAGYEKKVNLYCGSLLTAFGAGMLLLYKKKTKESERKW